MAFAGQYKTGLGVTAIELQTWQTGKIAARNVVPEIFPLEEQRSRISLPSAAALTGIHDAGPSRVAAIMAVRKRLRSIPYPLIHARRARFAPSDRHAAQTFGWIVPLDPLSSSLHFAGGLFNESCHSIGLRDVDSWLALTSIL
jgi:hypothetical protein